MSIVKIILITTIIVLGLINLHDFARTKEFDMDLQEFIEKKGTDE